jgi:hypothetical protein
VDDEFFTQPRPSRAELPKVSNRLAAFARLHSHFPFDPRKKILLSPMKVMVRKNNEEAVELVKRLKRTTNWSSRSTHLPLPTARTASS